LKQRNRDEVQVLKDGALSAELAAGVRVVVVYW